MNDLRDKLMKIIVKILFTIVFFLHSKLIGIANPPITAIEIYCDTEGIPIYVDGIKIGISPITSHSSRPWLASS